MTSRTIKIEDKLAEYVETCCDEIKDELISHIKENDLVEGDDVPCLQNDLNYSGAVDEHIDSAVPIYIKEIDDLWYLYGNEFEAAYEDAGVGDNPKENHGMAAIYYYISEKVNEWYSKESEEIFEEQIDLAKRLDSSFVDKSLSHATMIEEDIVEAIQAALKGVLDEDHDLWVSIEEFWDAEKGSEDRTVLLNEDIWEAMNEIAPKGTSFGSHPGDGSDFGFWTWDEDE